MEIQQVVLMSAQTSFNPVTQGKIGKEMLRFFFPILWGSLFQQIYNTADALIVGRHLGKTALSAVGASSGMIIMLVVGFFVGLSSGASVLVSQYIGSGQEKETHDTIHTAILFSLVCGLIVTISGIAMTPMLLSWMQTPLDTMQQSTIYLQVYFAGMIGNLIYNVGSGILRAAGDSRRPFCYLVISCLLNIILDLAFIIHLDLGVFGAGLATILSQAVSALLVILALVRSKGPCRLQLTELKMERSYLNKIIHIGLPAGLQSIMYGISNIIIQVAVNGLGTDYVAAWATYYKIDGVFWMTVSAFAIVGATFVGQNYGAGQSERVKRCIRINLLQAFAAAALISLFVYFSAPWLFPLFSNDAGVNRIGVDMMRYLTRFYILYVSIEILSGVLRGVGDTFIPMLICGIGVCLLRSLWILLVTPISNNIYTIMVSYPISWVTSSLAFYIYAFRFSRLKKLYRRSHK